jgi:hypothetical protein
MKSGLRHLGGRLRSSFLSFAGGAPLSIDCPVPRLTLLFFGAAKDIPEAAKTVTAGTASLRCNCNLTAKTWVLPSGATAPEEVHHQSNHRYDQQKVNQPAGNVEREKSQQPQHQQNNKQPQKH